MIIKLFFYALIGAAVLTFFLDTIPANEDFNTCHLQIQNSVSQVERYANSRGYSTQRICTSRQQALLQERSCIDEVNEKRLTAEVVFWFTQSRPKINGIFREHNRNCSDAKIDLYEIVVE